MGPVLSRPARVSPPLAGRRLDGQRLFALMQIKAGSRQQAHYRYRRNSAASASAVRCMLKGATKCPLLSIKYTMAV